MKIKVLGAIIGAALASQAQAVVVFSDTFGTDLSQWNGGSSGAIVAAPGGGNALAFSHNGSGGDLFAANPISSPSGVFHISFEYLGTCGQGTSCGGFIGFNSASGETWLSGDGPYPSSQPIVPTGSWQTFSFDFTSSSPFILKIEDWAGASDGPTPGNAYFRNLTISSGAVPEPATWGLMIAGFVMVGAAARRRNRIAVAA